MNQAPAAIEKEISQKAFLRKLGPVLQAAEVYPYDFTLDGCEEVADALEAAQFSCIKSFIPDGPGWCGDIYTIFWGCSAAFTIVKYSKTGNTYVECYNEGRMYMEVTLRPTLIWTRLSTIESAEEALK